jgi:hypothetical protein
MPKPFFDSTYRLSVNSDDDLLRRKFMHGSFASRATRLILLACGLLPWNVGRADSFQSVTYDAAKDELVIVVRYRGTNPDHQFSLKWGDCVDHGDNRREIVAELLDQQFQDAARQNFRQTLHMSLAAMDCRPAAVTLRTAPRFYYTLTVPARSAAAGRS